MYNIKTEMWNRLFLIVFLGLSHLVVTSDVFFSLLKRKTATERPFEVWGFPRFWEGGGTVKENCLARPIKKICPKCMPLKVHPIKNELVKFLLKKLWFKMFWWIVKTEILLEILIWSDKILISSEEYRPFDMTCVDLLWQIICLSEWALRFMQDQPKGWQTWSESRSPIKTNHILI